MKRFSCDFETVNKEEDCRVWMWGSVELYNHNNYKWGLDTKSFFEWCETLEDKTIIYFHNLKFDGEFLMYFFFRNGFEWTDRNRLYEKEFKTLITDMGVWYAVEFNVNGNAIKVYDSLKILSLGVKALPKSFGFDTENKKEKIDYNKDRPIGYQPDDDEHLYMHEDVIIVAKALEMMLDEGHDAMTQASNAMKFYMNMKTVGKKKFKKWFPTLDFHVDKYLRESYKGGWTYTNPKYQGKEQKKGLVVDNNSIYPYVMSSKKLPYGEPIYFTGKYEHDDLYNLYVSSFRCQFELKEGHVPIVQLKHSLGFKPTEYVEDGSEFDGILRMTSVDLEMFFEHYKVYNLEWLDGWKFKSTDMLFKDYINHWTEIKIKSKVERNKGMYTIAKFFLNMLYGKFGLNPNVQSKIPTYIEEKDKVKYILGDEKTRPPIYVALASFVTAYARQITIGGAQSNFDRFMYSDTDSLHLEGWETPQGIELHPTKLGAWDVELYFHRAKYIHAKCYIEEKSHDNDGNIFVMKNPCKCNDPECEEPKRYYPPVEIACAGLPRDSRTGITIELFQSGLVIKNGKRQAKRVSGGVMITDIDFSIKWE